MHFHNNRKQLFQFEDFRLADAMETVTCCLYLTYDKCFLIHNELVLKLQCRNQHHHQNLACSYSSSFPLIPTYTMVIDLDTLCWSHQVLQLIHYISSHVQFNPFLFRFGFYTLGDANVFKQPTIDGIVISLLTLHRHLRTLRLFRWKAHSDLLDIVVFLQNQLNRYVH